MADNVIEHYVAPVQDAPLGAVDAVDVAEKPRTLWTDAWHAMRRRAMFWASIVIIVAIVVVAIFPGIVSSAQPNSDCFLENSDAGPQPGHPLGFTKQGCDVAARIAHGASASLTVGFLAMLMVVVVGVIVGAIAGYYGGWLDAVLSRLGDIFFSVPTVLGAIVVMQLFQGARNPLVIAMVLAIFAWPQISRITRGAVLEARASDFVTASYALGLSRFRILLRHVLPNAIAPVIVVATVSLGTFIVAEATLSFLGIGLDGSSVMSWGNDINQARNSLRTNPWPLIYPSIALSLTVLSFIMLGDVVRDALDPKARARA